MTLANSFGHSVALGSGSEESIFQNVYSVLFDGTNDYMTTGADGTLADKTYCFWAKSSDTSATARNTVFAHGANEKGGFHLNWGGSLPLLYMDASYWRKWVDNSAQDDGAWHFYCVFIDASDVTGSKLYIDGSLQTVSADSTGGAPAESYLDLVIGRSYASGEHFNGAISDFAVFVGEVDAAAIAAMYNGGNPINLTHKKGNYTYTWALLHWWRMGDDGGTGVFIPDHATRGVGAELVTNGTMEADSNWNDFNTPTTNERSTEQVHSGTYSRKFISDVTGEGIKSDTFAVTAGKTYKAEAWYYAVAPSSFLFRVANGDGGDWGSSYPITATDAWTQITFFVIPTISGSSSFIKMYQNGSGTKTAYLDDVSVIEFDGKPGVLESGAVIQTDAP